MKINESDLVSSSDTSPHLRRRCPRASQIITSQLHPLNDSDSSLELTGTFSTTDELKAPAVVSTMGARGGGGFGGAPGPQTQSAAYTGGVRGGAADADEGQAAEADDDRCVFFWNMVLQVEVGGGKLQQYV